MTTQTIDNLNDIAASIYTSHDASQDAILHFEIASRTLLREWLGVNPAPIREAALRAAAAAIAVLELTDRQIRDQSPEDYL